MGPLQLSHSTPQIDASRAASVASSAGLAQPTDWLDTVNGWFMGEKEARSHDRHPVYDPIADQQLRFRIQGTGPVSTREIVPLSTGAKQLDGPATELTTKVLRGVLNLVETAAGGPEASQATRMTGIALSGTQEGHIANGIRAHIEEDQLLRASLKPLRGQKRLDALRTTLDASVAHIGDNAAHVLEGWINIGPVPSYTLMAATAAGPVRDPSLPMPDQHDVAKAVRLLRHEAQHIINDNAGNLNHPRAKMLLNEMSAEANSTELPDLIKAAKALGVNEQTSPIALAGAALERYYPQSEQVMSGLLTRIGIAPKSDEARQLMARPMAEVTEVLVERLAATSGTTSDQARQELSDLFQANVPYKHV